MAANESTDGGDLERDRCRAVTEVALKEAAARCGSEEAVKEQFRMMLGFTDEEPDPDCGAALGEGVTEETVESPRGLNQWVFCYAWKQFNEGEADNIGDALEAAWAESKVRANERGLEI